MAIVNSACIYGLPIRFQTIIRDFKECKAEVRTFASGHLSVSLEKQYAQNKLINVMSIFLYTVCDLHVVYKTWHKNFLLR